MRAYFFGNMYLSSIQQGIQAKHCGDEMVVNYAPGINNGVLESANIDKYRQLLDYLTNHKTVICLNAGYSSTLHEIYAGLNDTDNPYPFAKFHESEEALDGALTCVGIMVPDAIYDTAKEARITSRSGKFGRQVVEEFNRSGEWTSDADVPVNYTFTKWQVWLINELNKYGLAK